MGTSVASMVGFEARFGLTAMETVCPIADADAVTNSRDAAHRHRG